MLRTWLVLPLLVIAGLPLLAGAQVRVTSMYGPVEIHPAGEPRMAWVDSRSEDELPMLATGDRIVTGMNGQVTLELQDGSYIVVSENSTLEVERHWGAGLRDLMRVFVGRVKFHIQRLGGRPNPYRIHTPTALIAVRGTDFEVRVHPVADSTEVWTYEGRVTVEGIGVPDREVILDKGRKTLVRSGQAPLTPVELEGEFGASRILEVVRTDDPNAAEPGAVIAPGVPGSIGIDAIGIDNDRRHQTIDPLATGASATSMSTRRLKLSYPQR